MDKQRFRNVIPGGLRKIEELKNPEMEKKAGKWSLFGARRDGGKPAYPNDNLFFCTIQKAGSTWIDRVFHDPAVRERTGLGVDQYQELPEKIQLSPVPVARPNTILTRLYLDHGTYEKIEKPRAYKTIYIVRDPRDIVVSWYYSCKYSHTPNYLVAQVRTNLLSMEKDEGIEYSISYLAQYGAFDAMSSWIGVDRVDPLVKIFRYEDIVENDVVQFRNMLSHCDIALSEGDLEELVKRYRFSGISGRDRGTEDKKSHFRKGLPGDWKNHFNQSHEEAIMQKARDVLSGYGYE